MKKRTTKRALLMSALSLFVCVSMLIGTTFAWFTDSVTSGNNIIKAGNLDVDLEMKDADGNWVSAEGKTLGWLAADGRSQDEILWEPGATYNLTDVRIINDGSLALKYKVIISGVDGDAKLLEAIEFTYGGFDVDAEGYLLPGEYTDAITITGHMKEEAGNEYQGLSIEGIGITVIATQYTYEEDSFGKDYDDEAPLNFLPVSTADEFLNALENGAVADMKDDVTLSGPVGATSNTNIVINGNGNTLSVSDPSATRVIEVQGDANEPPIENVSIELNNVNVDAAGKERALSVYNTKNTHIDVNNSTVTAEKYGLNIANYNTNLELNVTDSTIQGWAAIQTWSANSVINVENSTLIGKNIFDQSAPNNFGTLVVETNGAGSTITVKNSRIEANSTAGSIQYFAIIKAAGVTMIFENCTFVKDGVELTDVSDIAQNFNVYNPGNTSLTINGVEIG